jgi:hypothetical protein
MDDLVKAVLDFRDEREWSVASDTMHLTYFIYLGTFAGILAGEQ